jgi:hypothetical protein
MAPNEPANPTVFPICLTVRFHENEGAASSDRRWPIAPGYVVEAATDPEQPVTAVRNRARHGSTPCIPEHCFLLYLPTDLPEEAVLRV